MALIELILFDGHGYIKKQKFCLYEHFCGIWNLMTIHIKGLIVAWN